MLLTSPPVFADYSLLPATPLRPVTGAVLPKAERRVRFVWEPPAAPVPVRYFVEVVRLGTGRPRLVFATYVDKPWAEVVIPPAAAHYAWRVYVVPRAGGDYAVSPWQRFSRGASP